MAAAELSIASALAGFTPESVDGLTPLLEQINARLGSDPVTLASLAALGRRDPAAEALMREVLNRIYADVEAWRCAPFASRCVAEPHWEEPWSSTAR